jgi:hypothetical protein
VFQRKHINFRIDRASAKPVHIQIKLEPSGQTELCRMFIGFLSNHSCLDVCVSFCEPGQLSIVYCPAVKNSSAGGHSAAAYYPSPVDEASDSVVCAAELLPLFARALPQHGRPRDPNKLLVAGPSCDFLRETLEGDPNLSDLDHAMLQQLPARASSASTEA